MSAGPQVAWLPDGRRLHLHHGPIDLILDAEGPGRRAALAAAAARFDTLLAGLVTELAVLRRPVDARFCATDPVARRMIAAVRPHAGVFVTPMAAVAGAVADEILAAMHAAGDLRRAYVNNGGDIAVHLGPGESFSALGPCGPVRLTADDAARGLATSGWRGRSHSLGIADGVTVAAKTAADADVAATLIANAVDLPGHPAVSRRPARELSPDSDLGDRPVTVAVGALSPADARRALASGEAAARRCLSAGLIASAALTLQGLVAQVSQRQRGGPARPIVAAASPGSTTAQDPARTAATCP